MVTATLGDVVAALEAAYPPALAEDWDAVGLVCGDPDEPVRRVLFAVDPVAETVAEALAVGAQLLVTHHPLLLRGVHEVAADDPKGALVHRLVRAGAGLFCAHTNADAADPGVSDALAAALGLAVQGPLAPRSADPLDALAVFVPLADTERVLAALAAAGAGRAGGYADAAWTVEGTGRFRPLPGAQPAIGRVGELSRVPETRVDLVLPRRARRAVLAALQAAHPYEQPAYTLHEQVDTGARTGLGRVGELPAAEPLRAFTARVARALPATAWGVRAAGDPDRPVRRVAVCGGAGDSLLGAAGSAGVDAYVTGDLRHHPAAEHLAGGGPALVDVAHWAGEWPWCAQVASVVRRALAGTVDVLVSHRRTDPWTIGAASGGEEVPAMNADPAAQRHLLDLADVDAELARIAHRRRSMPELAEVEATERERQSCRDAVVTAETAISDLDRDIRKLEGEIDQVRAREDRDRGLLGSGAISSGKQLEDLQHELETLARRQANLEDDQLEVMEQREATESELARSRAALVDVEARLSDAVRRRDEALADLEVAEARRSAERGPLVAGLPADLLALYDRVRARGGTGAALLRHRRCGACRLELDRNAIAHLRDAPAESVQRCEECGVVLVRTAESGL